MIFLDTGFHGSILQRCDFHIYVPLYISHQLFIVQQDAIELDEDLLDNSARSLETLVSVGMTLGTSTRKRAREESIRRLKKLDLV